MRHLSSVWLVTLGLLAATGGWAQERVDDQGLDRGPRFLLAAAGGGERVPVDVRRTPSLRQRISVAFDGTTLGEALREISRQGNLRLFYSRHTVPLESPVQLRADNITVAGALSEVLLDVGVDVLMSPDGRAALVRRGAPAPVQGGSISGRVTDAETGQGLGGAEVLLEGTRWRVLTADYGQYRLAEVAAGTYTLVVRRIGYARASRAVTVAAERETTADFALDQAPTRLEEVVVTGTVIPTEIRALPTPVTVVTAEEIEAQQIRRVDQIFRTNVPGSISWDQGTSDYTNSITVRGTSSLLGSGLNSIKTYVDGIEASSDLFSIIDVNSIERVEIIRGPQASTVHGSGASSGVLQIFTKKGDLGLRSPQVTAAASAGAVQSAYESSAQQDYSVKLHGGSQELSYHLGGSYSHTGEWVANYSSRVPSFFAGGRLVQGPLILDLSARYMSRLLQGPNDPRLRVYDFGNPLEEYYAYQTYGLALSYRATARWQHTVILGNDRARQDLYSTRARESDSLFTVQSGPNDRVTLRYNTSLTLANGHAFTGSLTAGGALVNKCVNGVRRRAAFGWW